MVNLSVVNDRREASIQNVIVTIPGTLPEALDNPIVMGNHRDAWIFGAVDPNSGSAAMLEVLRGFAAAWRTGWRPRRTIVVGSWDAEEFGITGSTAYVTASCFGEPAPSSAALANLSPCAPLLPHSLLSLSPVPPLHPLTF
jgi:N-acetylated-alpha-linked acidic dipeptidase